MARLKGSVVFRVFIVAICALGGLASGQDAVPLAGNNRFGVVEGFWFPELTCELGAGWERIIFDWAQHQPGSPNDWHTLNVDDRWLKAASACNREVVALLKHTPAWATAGTPGVGIPLGLELPLDDPDNLWANFVRRTVEYYASRGVNHFIVWNEPDITADTYGYEFEGALGNYFRLLKVAYLVAKEANPAAVIHLAGTTYWHDVNNGRRPYVERLIERIQQDPDAENNGYYFDVISLHIYFRTDTVYDIVHEMRQLLDEKGLAHHTIWVNETNAAPTDDPDWPVQRPVYQLDLEQQAAFLAQAAALGLAAGAERMAVYKLYDQSLPAGGESFGILSPADAHPRPAFATWKMVTEQFRDVIEAAHARADGVEAVILFHRNERQTVVAWSRTGRESEIEIDALSDKAYLIDQYGNILILRAIDGVYRLKLPPARCNKVDGCPVGGSAQLLVQPRGDLNVREILATGVQQLIFE